VVEADIDYPTDADLLEHAVRKLGGLVRWPQERRRSVRDRGGIPDGWRMTSGVATVRMVDMDPELVRTADLDPELEAFIPLFPPPT
jgi:hypothetical protein